ncbi:hypothetical protein HMPREF9440_01768 [Sutterella parvirubra YIT 11816]|uniref:Uncharacterized protein n=1 Tax=Sutterella parvirubra YIT 11816 TaxID=762967 RepID=H3KG88_9BURK|nr:hypothetical protein HMPREF9440_01768 [Sutterella parvirubra YIT 11816]
MLLVHDGVGPFSGFLEVGLFVGSGSGGGAARPFCCLLLFGAGRGRALRA